MWKSIDEKRPYIDGERIYMRISEREKAIWRAAITLANNICVQESDKLNGDDAPCEAIDAANKCARRIRGCAEPDAEQLAEMFAEACVPENPRGVLANAT